MVPYGTAALFLLTPEAKQDAWISMLIYIIPGIILQLIYVKLWEKYPKDTIVTYMPKIFGKVIGYTLSIIFIVYFAYEAARGTRDIIEIILIAVMPRMSMYIIGIVLMSTVIYGTFDEAKKAHPESKTTEENYNLYWSTGDAVSKTLFEGPVRLLREFPELGSVTIKIPFEGKTYSVDIDRATAEKYFNVNLAEMHKDASNELWRQQIVAPYTSNKDQRAKYTAQFIKVSQ